MVKLIPYIVILLAISALAMSFIVRVLVQQLRLYKYHIQDKHVRYFRNMLFAISVTIIVMGMIPIAINVFTLFAPSGRPAVISPISLIYSLGVHLQTLLLSYLLWRIYRLANGDFNDKLK